MGERDDLIDVIESTPVEGRMGLKDVAPDVDAEILADAILNRFGSLNALVERKTSEAKLIEEAITAYLGLIDYPEGDASHLYAAPVGHPYHLPTHSPWVVDGDLDVTALAEAIAKAVNDGFVTHPD